MEENNYKYELEFLVRDYECDLQGIVNNAVYQHYLEHARHEFIKQAGLDFAKLHQDGIDAVVYRIEMDYKSSLTSGDTFSVKVNLNREGKLRFIFSQDIYKKTGELVLKAKVFTTFSRNGRPIQPPEEVIDALFNLG